MPAEVRIRTPLLDIACEVSGPEDGSPLILLHGWPDGVRTWDNVLPPLHDAGWQTYVPWLRGYGGTRFLSGKTVRSGQVSALARDALGLAEGLKFDRFAIAGHDWGARAAYAASCLAPERVSCCIAISIGYGAKDPTQDLPLKQVQNFWYQWYMALDRGERLLREEREAFTRYIWDVWNPGFDISAADFAETVQGFSNPDWADVVLHYYRVRWGLAEPDPAYAETETRLASDPTISVPTLVLHGRADPCTDPSTSAAQEHLFKGSYERIVMEGIGHFPQRQMPRGVAEHMRAFLQAHA